MPRVRQPSRARSPGSRPTRLLLFNKPYGVVTQFRALANRSTLGDFIADRDVHPAGRLDHDSEGLLLLTNDGYLQHRLTDPRHKLPKTYWAQVEGEPTEEALEKLRHGVLLDDKRTRPAQARRIAEPSLWPRDPPVRFRKHIPTSWIELTLIEGRNRQVRRMTAAVGFPTLRLVRVAIGPYRLTDLQPGQWHEATSPKDGLVPRTRRPPGTSGRTTAWKREQLPARAAAAPALVESAHDLEAERGGRRDHRTRRPVPAGRGGSRRRAGAQPARRPSR